MLNTIFVLKISKLLTFFVCGLILTRDGKSKKVIHTLCTSFEHYKLKMEHVPVLKETVYEYLDLKKGDVVVDATLGLGGHAKGMLEKIGKKGVLIGLDQDERNLEEAKKRLEGASGGKNIILVNDNFRYLKNRAEETGFKEVDAVLFDLGISSPHVDDSERGFSFMRDGPLDMRFSLSQKLTAWDVVNSYPENELANVIFQYGEERASRRIARKICEYRKNKKFEGTAELGEFIKRVIPDMSKHGKRGVHHPATKTFQAIRIEVNDELNALKEGLNGSMSLLKIGGKIVVISYHSLEDRIVKHFFKELSRSCVCPPEVLVCQCRGAPVVEILTKKPVFPTDEEIAENPRARSAKLRAVKKLTSFS